MQQYPDPSNAIRILPYSLDPSQGHDRGGAKPLFVTWHRQQGENDLYDEFLGRPAGNRADSTFWVEKTGKITRLLTDSVAPWTNGFWANSPNLANPLIAQLYRQTGGKGGTNAWAITIETAGNVDEPLTEQQIDACARIAAYCYFALGIPADRIHHVGHGEVGEHQYCPGKLFQFDEILRRANLIIAQVQGNSNIPVGMVALDNPNKLDIYKDAWSDPSSGLIVLQPFANFYRDNGGQAKFGKPTSGMYGATGSEEQQFKYAHFYLDKASGKVVAEMKDRNNPQGFDVGPGMLGTAKKLGYELETNEEFYIPDPAKPQPGLGKLSLAWASNPADGQVHIFMAIEHKEQVQPDGTIPWEVKVVKEEV
jgi:hypothetical protein